MFSILSDSLPLTMLTLSVGPNEEGTSAAYIDIP